MKQQPAAPNYKRHRYPPAIIGHAVWRSFRFALSDRDVAELLAERGVIVTDETARQWCRSSGRPTRTRSVAVARVQALRGCSGSRRRPSIE